MASKPPSRHPLMSMAEPGTSDIARALFVAVFLARENLSLAERDEDILRPGRPMANLQSALLNLRTANGYINTPPLSKTVTAADKLLSQQTIHAAEAAEAHLGRLHCASSLVCEMCGGSGQVYGGIDCSACDGPTPANRKAVNICRRAIEGARKDAHKLLVVVMERFPHSYDTDEMFDGEEEKEDEVRSF